MIACTVNWREYVLDQLSLVDGCVRDILSEHIRTAFCIFAPLACGDEFLNALYAKRYLLSVLIAQFTSAVDYYTSKARDIGRYKRETRSRSDMQAESVAQSSRRADTVAISREDSFNRSEARSVSQDYSASQSAGNQSTVMDDIGSGASRSLALGTQLERGNTSEDASSRSDSSGRNTNVDSFASYSFGAGGTVSQTALFQITSSSAEGQSEFFCSNQRGRGSQFETGSSRGIYTTSSLDQDEATATSFSYFNELMDIISQQNFASSGLSRGATDSTTTQRDEGRGFGIAESRSTTQQSSRYDMKSDSEMESEIEGKTVMNQEVFAKDLSDIVRHLHWMYDNNEADIKEYVASRNRMIFINDYLQRFAEKPKCWDKIFVPVLLKHDNLNVCLN